MREKTSLSANIASLERQMADLNKTNDLLKTKVRLIVPWQLEPRGLVAIMTLQFL